MEKFQVLTIPNGSGTSNAFKVTPYAMPAKFIFNATYTNTALALQEFRPDTEAWVPVCDETGAAISIPVVASSSVNLPPFIAANLVNDIRLVGVANEGAERTVTVQWRQL